MGSVCIAPASHSAASPVGDSSVTSVPMALRRFDDVSVAVRNRRARVAVAALFLTNGALFANLLPRYPEIKADLALSNSAYGVAIAAFSAGALVAGPAAAAVIRRFRSAVAAVAGSIGIAVFVFVASLAPSAVALAAALFVAGAFDAITDVGRTLTRCGCSATTDARSSTRCTRCGRRGRCSAARWVRSRSRWTSRARHIWRCRRRCSALWCSPPIRFCSAAPTPTITRRRERTT